MIVNSKEWAITFLNNIVFLLIPWILYNIIWLYLPHSSLNSIQIHSLFLALPNFILVLKTITHKVHLFWVWDYPLEHGGILPGINKQTNKRLFLFQGHQLLVAPQLGMGILEPPSCLSCLCVAVLHGLILYRQHSHLEFLSTAAMECSENHFTLILPALWLLQPFHLLFCKDPWAGLVEESREMGSDSDVRFVAEHSTDTQFLYLAQLWISVLAIRCTEKLLWRGLGAAHTHLKK